jgi:hypothetical protein
MLKSLHPTEQGTPSEGDGCLSLMFSALSYSQQNTCTFKLHGLLPKEGEAWRAAKCFNTEVSVSMFGC